MYKNIFITGTDTDIGKTVASTILVNGLQRNYWKPIQCGTSPQTDREFVTQYLGDNQTYPETYLFTNPVSPHLAARLEGTVIQIDNCVDFYKNIKTPLIIEGAGGILTPLTDDSYILDLIEALNNFHPCDVILVASTRIGTINHTLLSLQKIRERGLNLLGTIMIGKPNSENKTAIETMGKVEVIAEIPWLENITKEVLLNIFKTIDQEKLGVPLWNQTSETL